MPDVRMLTVTNGFPLQARYVEFSVKGISNPTSTKPSGNFNVSLQKREDGSWVTLETENGELTTKATTGLLQN